MRHFNVHWKGYPHHRLPRIRLVSIHSHGNTSVTTFRPLPSILEQERKKQRLNIFRRRRQASRSSSSGVRARKRRIAQKARHHLQVFGWDSPHAEAASKTSKITYSNQTSDPSAERTKPLVLPHPHLDNTPTQTTVIDSNDGAASSLMRVAKAKSKKADTRYSLMHVVDAVPKYINHKKPFPAVVQTAGAGRPSEYAHVGPLDTVSRPSQYYSPEDIGRSRTYDIRIDPKNRVQKTQRRQTAPAQTQTANIKSRKTESRARNQEKRASQALFKAVSTVASRSKESPVSAASVRSIVQSILSDAPSRTPSQRRALKQFTKELSLYLQATKSLPKKSLLPSPSATTISANTIEVLKPYQAEFDSAGLAVTSSEQRKSLPMAKLKKPSEAAQPPTKDGVSPLKGSTTNHQMVRATPDQKQDHRHHGLGNQASISTGTTVMGWTPPHEATTPLPRHRRNSLSVESDHTVMGWTPPHEAAEKEIPPTPPRTERAITKKSLPWLRQREPTYDQPPSPTAKELRGSMPFHATVEDERSASSLVMNIPRTPPAPASKIEDVQMPSIPPRPSRHRNTEVRFDDYRPNQSSFSMEPVYQQHKDTPDEHVADAKTPREVEYSDAMIQTDTPPKQVDAGAGKEEDSKPQQAPIMTTGRSKTFPLKTASCNHKIKGNDTGSIVATRRPTASRHHYEDQAIQVCMVDETQSALFTTPQRQLSSFKPVLSRPDRSRTFPATIGPSTSVRPFQTAFAYHSPYKSADEVEIRKSVAREEEAKEERQVMPPTRPAPSPPRLPDVDLASFIGPELATFINEQHTASEKSSLEYEYLPRVQQRSLPVHTCTARSSLCQQCTPPRKVSVPSSPMDFVSLSPPTEQPTLEVRREKTFAVVNKVPSSDPIKRPTVPQVKDRQSPRDQARPVDRKRSSPLPPLPIVLDHPAALSETVTYSTLESPSVPQAISDKNVFRGLHVATAAACDEDVAMWIKEVTGVSVRQFLSDLSRFEGLGYNTLAGVARRAGKQRRGECRAWERVRERRRKGGLEQEGQEEHWVDEDDLEEPRVDRKRDRNSDGEAYGGGAAKGEPRRGREWDDPKLWIGKV